MAEFPPLDKEKIIGLAQCSVNQKGIHSNKEITLYKCDCMAKEDDLICGSCARKCHKNHKSKAIETRKSYSFICHCAKMNHNPNKQKLKIEDMPEIEENKEVNCSLEKFYKIFKFEKMFKNKHENKNYCVFCAVNCPINQDTKIEKTKIPGEEDEIIKVEEDDLQKQEDKFFTKFKFKNLNLNTRIIYEKLQENFTLIENPENFKCECSHQINHSSKEKEYIDLSKLIRKSIFHHLGINYNNFRHKIFDKNSNFYYETTAFYLRKNNFFKNNHKFEDALVQNFTEYIAIAKLIEAIGNTYKKSNICFFEQPEYQEFFNGFNLNFLTNLFDQKVNQIDDMVLVKKINLRIYRKFYLTPMINKQNFYTDQVDENITPLHRLLSNRNFSPDFYTDIVIDKNEFLDFLVKVQNNISKYFNEFYTITYSRDLFKLYNEFLHLVNVVVKYHLNEKEFVNNLVDSIYLFLRNLFTNQQQGKIYIIKKQILKLITKLALKMNDERLFKFIENNDLEHNQEFEFCFQNTEMNNKIFKIFLIINQKTHSHKSKDYILNEKVQYFLNLYMTENDGFSNNLDYISKNLKFSINFYQEKSNNQFSLNFFQKEKKDNYDLILESINSALNLLEKSLEDLYKLNISELDYALKVEDIFFKINEIMNSFIENNKRFNKIINQLQYLLYKNGYYTKLMHILTNVKQISKFISIDILKKIYEIIFKNILLFIHENPFLAILFATHKFCKILFHNEPEYNLSLFTLYNKIFKMICKYSYRIDPRPFFDNFKIHFNQENIFNLEKNEMYSQLYSIGSIYDNAISVTNRNVKQIIYQMISEDIKNIFVNDLFSKKLKIITEKLKENADINNLPEKEKHLIWCYKNFLRILNHISDGHFLATISNINTDISNSLVEDLLKIKFLHPNLRRSLIGFYTKSRIQLPYKIFKSSDFNEKVFQGITNEIPFMTKDCEKAFSIPSQLIELDTVCEELLIFPKNFIKHEEYFKIHKVAFFKYFAEGIFLPSINCMYKVAYFNEEINSELKYAIYKVLVLFCKCFYFFLRKIEILEFYDENLFLDYLCIDVGLSQLNEFGGKMYDSDYYMTQMKNTCENIKQKLEADLKELNEPNFLIKDNIIFKKFIFYKQFYFLKSKIYQDINEDNNENLNGNSAGNKNNNNNKIPPPPNEPNQYSNIENNNGNDNNNNEIEENKDHDIFYSSFMKQIEIFLEDFKKKKDYNNQNLIYHEVMADEKTHTEKFCVKGAMVDFKLRKDFKRSYFLLLFDKIIDFDNKLENLSYEFQENISTILENLVKIFKLDPSFCQEVLLEEKNKENSKLLMEQNILKSLTCLFQIIFIEFNTINSNDGKSSYKNIINILEFIRLHCENHNRIFQTFLCYFDIASKKNSDEKESKFYLIKFILKVFKLIYDFVNFKLKKKEILSCFGLGEIHFFDKLLAKIVEFLVEIYQGNFPYNYDSLLNDDYEFFYFLEIFLKTFDDIENAVELEFIVTNFMTFYLALLEDYDMSDKNKNAITMKLNVKLILQTISFCVKKCTIKFCLNKENIDIDDQSCIIPKNSAEILLNAYQMNINNISDYHLFKLMTKSFMLLNILTDLGNIKAIDTKLKMEALHEKFKNTFMMNDNDRSYSNNIMKINTYKLLISLVKRVEINFTRPKSNFVNNEKYLSEVEKEVLETIDNSIENEGEEESQIKSVNFLVDKESLFLTTEDLKDYISKIPIDNYNTRLYLLVSNIPNLIDTMNFKKDINPKNFRYSNLLLILSNLDYSYFEYISMVFILIVNLMLQWTMTYENIKNGKSDYYQIIIVLAIVNIIFLGLTLLNYMFFKFWEIKKTSRLWVFYYMKNLLDEEVFFLFWNFVIGIIAVSTPICNFLFSLQLFGIISFFNTMKIVLITINNKWREFTSTLILIIILIIFFTGISFYFIRSYYLLEGMETNICSNYIYCFLTIMTYGIRNGGGIGDLQGRIDYSDPGFWYIFFFQWSFFFSIVLIMLNVINAIILDTFQDLSDKDKLRKEIKDNDCFICSRKRIDFQIKYLNFEEHINKEHNLLNYIDYLIKINQANEQELNSIDYQSLMCCRKKLTSFLPLNNSISLMRK